MKEKIYLSEEACSSLKRYIEDAGYETVFIDGKGSPVYEQVRTHADIYMCSTPEGIFMGDMEKLGEEYPENVRYNAVCTGKYFIHNLMHTDPDLMQKAVDMGLQMVNVKQGYARCSCLPVDDTSFITADMGMYRALKKAGAEVLLIKSGHISLPGHDTGFIGGCGGTIVKGGKRQMVFNGDLSSHPDFMAIRDFIEDRGIEVVYFIGHPLEDIGSILG